MYGNIKYWVWLSSLVGIPLGKRLKLLEYFQDPALLWEANEAQLRTLGFCTQKIIKWLLDKDARNDVDKLMERIYQCDADIIALNDSAYPIALKYIHDPPIVLYSRGKLEQDAICVAVVGSRRASAYGLDMAKRISRELAIYSVTIVSGMARGVDSKAHYGALEGKGKTIAVLGCGVDIAYPPENRDLMKKIIESGAVISEYLPGTQPLPYHFPARNRIISGLSRGVVIVEAGEKSGSLITTDFALEQGREVFAIPGNINSANSVGTNKLIKDGAKVITNTGDILDELKINHDLDYSFRINNRIREMKLSGNEKTIAERLLNGPVHIDAIARDCAISTQLVSSVLIMLELSGFVEQLPGKYFKLLE
ncbi:MAG: DNA-protecting protein DprA [Clostridiaceae bacterium]|nr:DNA-protecting protein DprA [Clostridiaceae bacterium]